LKKKIIITGVLSAVVLFGGVAMANYYHVINITAPLVSTQAPVQQETPTVGTLTLPGTEVMQPGTYTGAIVGGKANGSGKITFENGDDWVGIR
jgi:hypothetical protein